MLLLLNEPVKALRLVCIGLIIAGVIGLRLVSPEQAGRKKSPPASAADMV